MTTRVHFTHPPEAFEPLANLLDDSITISTGVEYPEDGVDVIVSGRPGDVIPEQTQMIVVPWAGIPEGVLAHARSRPRLRVHNLHHNAPQVAELAVGLLFAAAKRILSYDQGIRKGDWSLRYQPTEATLLWGKTALILGFGAIGRHAAMIFKGLGMHVIGMNRSGSGPETHQADEVLPITELASVLPRADVLLIALPLTEATRGLIDRQAIDLLPDGAYIINIGRGPIIDDWALYEALKAKKLGGAGLDVWWNYPQDEASRTNTLPADAPLQELDNVVMSPHRGGSVVERTPIWSAALADLLNAFARGETVPNQVDINAGY